MSNLTNLIGHRVMIRPGAPRQIVGSMGIVTRVSNTSDREYLVVRLDNNPWIEVNCTENQIHDEGFGERTLSGRVIDSKTKFTVIHGFSPSQIFLGPKERMELDVLIRQLPSYLSGKQDVPPEFMGMTVISLMSDGVRAGCTEAAE